MLVKKGLLVTVLMFLTLVEHGYLNTMEHCPNVRTSLASVRKRRHLTFPDGTTVSLTTSCVKTFMTHIPSGWYTVLEADLVYHLPDAKVQVQAHRRKKLHHRQKREFWESIQGVLDLRNINGRACIVRSICEAKTHLAPPGKSLVHDILRVVFTAPVNEEEFNEEIGFSYNELFDPDFCEKSAECPISILSFMLDLHKQKH